jgi:uncharacterized membrane protein
MGRLAAIYVATLAVFLAMDAVWLSLTAAPLYRATIGDLMIAAPRAAPAIAFYLLYVVGLMVFVIAAAQRAGRAAVALGRGALYGAIAYATYDLTNYATLRGWTLTLTAVDIAWGAVVSAVAATAGYGLGRRLAGGNPQSSAMRAR